MSTGTGHDIDDPEWSIAWKNILDHHTEDFAPSWFCFKFPLQIKTPTQPWTTPRQHGKLQRKVIGELTRKIKDINYYMAQSLNDLKKTKRRREKQAQRRALAASDNKQNKDRERFWMQAEAETAAAYTTFDLSPTT